MSKVIITITDLHLAQGYVMLILISFLSLETTLYFTDNLTLPGSFVHTRH